MKMIGFMATVGTVGLLATSTMWSQTSTAQDTGQAERELAEAREERAESVRDGFFGLRGRATKKAAEEAMNRFQEREAAQKSAEDARRAMHTSPFAAAQSALAVREAQIEREASMEDTPFMVAKDGAIALVEGQNRMPFWTSANGFHRLPGLFSSRTSESDRKASELASKYLRTRDKDERADLLDAVEETVARAFEEQIAARQKEIDELEASLDKMKKRLAERVELGDQIIERRVRDLTRQGDKLEWDDRRSFSTGYNRLSYPAPNQSGMFNNFPDVVAPVPPASPREPRAVRDGQRGRFGEPRSTRDRDRDEDRDRADIRDREKDRDREEY